MAYLDCTEQTESALRARSLDGPITIVNFLRFREVADYGATPALVPDTERSGREAYHRYLEAMTPHLTESGGEVLTQGAAGMFFIGPEDEAWDYVVVVRHASLDAFFGFSTKRSYVDALGHRLAALADARVLVVEHTPML